MGVGVSLGGLAGAVAACGGMGTISTADAGYQEPDFPTDPAGANLRALRREIGRAKELARGAGMVAVNAMVATRQFADAVRTAVAAGVDAVVCGAGLPLELPALTQGKTAIAPIVSSPRAARLLLKTWDRKYQTTADFLVLEGSRAGGHLGKIRAPHPGLSRRRDLERGGHGPAHPAGGGGDPDGHPLHCHLGVRRLPRL